MLSASPFVPCLDLRLLQESPQNELHRDSSDGSLLHNLLTSSWKATLVQMYVGMSGGFMCPPLVGTRADMTSSVNRVLLESP